MSTISTRAYLEGHHPHFNTLSKICVCLVLCVGICIYLLYLCRNSSDSWKCYNVLMTVWLQKCWFYYQNLRVLYLLWYVCCMHFVWLQHTWIRGATCTVLAFKTCEVYHLKCCTITSQGGPAVVAGLSSHSIACGYFKMMIVNKQWFYS